MWNRRFWQACLAGGLLTALLYFLLVYVRSAATARFWPALAALLTTWRGLEVLFTFCGLAAVSMAGAQWLHRHRSWRHLPAGLLAGGMTGLLYGTWLLAATGTANWSAALSGMLWFTVPFIIGGGMTAVWFYQGK